jgi:ribosomal protein S18 acetylase RimI-like enzyme
MRIEAATEATPELLEALTSLLPQLNPELPPLTMERLVRVVRDPATTLLVVRDGGTVAGTATVLVYSTPAHRKARIEDVVIDEGARGKGAGEALVRRCVEVAREKGAEIVELQSARWREVANRLYPRLGFERRDSNLYRLNL